MSIELHYGVSSVWYKRKTFSTQSMWLNNSQTTAEFYCVKSEQKLYEIHCFCTKVHMKKLNPVIYITASAESAGHVILAPKG
jgi:hypothetical protein